MTTDNVTRRSIIVGETKMKPSLVGVMLLAMTLPAYAQGVCIVVIPPNQTLGVQSLPAGPTTVGVLAGGEKVVVQDVSFLRDWFFVGGLFRRPDGSVDISAPISRGWVAASYLRCK
jgi:hypothetical protein